MLVPTLPENLVLLCGVPHPPENTLVYRKTPLFTGKHLCCVPAWDLQRGIPESHRKYGTESDLGSKVIRQSIFNDQLKTGKPISLVD